MIKLVRDAFIGILDILLPAFCINCKEPLVNRKLICETCYNTISKLNPDLINIFISRIQKPNFDQAYIIFEFCPLFQHLMHLFKYEGFEELASYFAGSILESVSGDYDIVTCVPLNMVKKRERGFNQSEIIAKIYAKNSQLEFMPDLLTRTRYTVSQTKLSREERINNVAKAFMVQKDVRDLKILIIDDVTTTGSTLNECAFELKQNGCASVDILAMATPVNILQEKLETDGFKA